MINVVAALIINDNKILIAKRKTGDYSVFDKWEFPGGKVEEYENDFEAIKREIKEEFDVEIEGVNFITNNICNYPKKIVNLKLIECKYISGEFKLIDHSLFKWVTCDELLSFDLAEADIPLAKFVIENFKMDI